MSKGTRESSEAFVGSIFKSCVCTGGKSVSNRKKHNKDLADLEGLPESKARSNALALILFLSFVPKQQTGSDVTESSHVIQKLTPSIHVRARSLRNHVEFFKILPADTEPGCSPGDHQGNFPEWYKLAGKYLSVPATSVQSERIFSTAGEVQRSQL